jgi:hypothetical protein
MRLKNENKIKCIPGLDKVARILQASICVTTSALRAIRLSMRKHAPFTMKDPISARSGNKYVSWINIYFKKKTKKGKMIETQNVDLVPFKIK